MTIDKPSDREDEFFARLDAEKVKRLRGSLDARREEESKRHKAQAHWMKCPKCGGGLEENNYQDVMIDRCTTCGGIWLDKGELELLVEAQARLGKGFLNKLFGG